jgi:hypothetical protein
MISFSGMRRSERGYRVRATREDMCQASGRARAAPKPAARLPANFFKLFGKEKLVFVKYLSSICQVFPNIPLAVLSVFNGLRGEKSFFFEKNAFCQIY